MMFENDEILSKPEMKNDNWNKRRAMRALPGLDGKGKIQV